MKAASLKEIKLELYTRTPEELLEFCLRLSKFKKENKELLTYLLFEAYDEPSYIANVKLEIDEQFDLINKRSYYLIKKGVRKILANTKKYIRYSKQKNTEIELMIYFCSKLNSFSPSIHKHTALHNLYNRQIVAIKKAIATLHEDLQYDYETEMENLL